MKFRLCISFLNKYGFVILLAHWWGLYHTPKLLADLWDRISITLGVHLTLLLVVITDILLAAVLGYVMENYVIRLPMLLAECILKTVKHFEQRTDTVG